MKIMWLIFAEELCSLAPPIPIHKSRLPLPSVHKTVNIGNEYKYRTNVLNTGDHCIIQNTFELQ